MVDTWLVMLGLSINGFFTGLGVVTANTLFELLVKPKIAVFHKRLKGVKIG